MRLPRESWLRTGGRSCHVAPRSGADGGRPPSLAVPVHVARTGRNQCGTAHARIKLSGCTASGETGSAVARAHVPHKSALWIGGHNWHVAPRSCNEGEVPSAATVRFTVPEPTTTGAARRARAASSRAAPPPERQPAQWRARTCHEKAACASEAATDTWHHGLATEQRDLPPLQFPHNA